MSHTCLLSVSDTLRFMTSALQLLPLQLETKGPLRNIHIFPHAWLKLETSSHKLQSFESGQS